MTSVLHERAGEYLRLRRALGFRLRREGDILPQFADYLEQRGAAAVTAEHTIAWAQLPQGVHPVTWTHRLSAVRGFAAWLRTVDPATEIPPKGVFPGQGRRPVRRRSGFRWRRVGAVLGNPMGDGGCGGWGCFRRRRHLADGVGWVRCPVVTML